MSVCCQTPGGRARKRAVNFGFAVCGYHGKARCRTGSECNSVGRRIAPLFTSKLTLRMPNGENAKPDITVTSVTFEPDGGEKNAPNVGLVRVGFPENSASRSGEFTNCPPMRKSQSPKQSASN